MKRLRRLLGSLALGSTLALLGTASPVHASGYLVPEMDAEAWAQSEAWAARARGPSAIFYNPAGLTQIDGFEFSGGTTLIQLKSKFTGPAPLSFETETTNGLAPPSHAFLGYKLGDSIAIGIGVHTSFGLIVEWPQAWPDNTHFGAFEIQKVDLRTYNINPTIAYAVNENLSFGVGLQWVLSKATLDNETDLSPLAAALHLPGLSPLGLELKANNGGGNFGFDVGLLYKTDKFGLGVSYRGPVTLKLDGDANFTIAPTGIPPIDAALNALFPDQKGSTEVPLPNLVMGGVAYRPSDKTEVEFDVNWASWSDFDKLTIDFSQNTFVPGTQIPVLADRTIRQDWKNGFTYRLGGSYDVSDDVELRLGGIYDPTVIPDSTLRPLLPEADRYGVNAGVGFKLGNVDLDLAYLFLTTKERTTTTNIEGFNGTYNTHAHLFGVTFSFHSGGKASSKT
jgi:long-chain fatty acid transport protein